LRRRLARFQSRTNFLQARGKRFNLLLLVCRDCLEVLLLLCHRRFQFSDRRLLFFHLAVLFEKLVEQHRVNRLITDGIGFSLLVAGHQIGIYLLHFLSHEPKLRDGIGV